jgi:amino acid transporter
MTYLNVILTLIFIVLALMFISNGVFNLIGEKDHKSMKKYNELVNKLSLELHEEILKEIKAWRKEKKGTP